MTKTGPQQITIDPCCAPPRFGYTITINYVGPPLTGPVQTTFTDRLPAQVMNPGIAEGVEGFIFNCTFPPQGVGGGTVSCDVGFSPMSR